MTGPFPRTHHHISLRHQPRQILQLGHFRSGDGSCNSGCPVLVHQRRHPRNEPFRAPRGGEHRHLPAAALHQCAHHRPRIGPRTHDQRPHAPPLRGRHWVAWRRIAVGSVTLGSIARHNVALLSVALGRIARRSITQRNGVRRTRPQAALFRHVQGSLYQRHPASLYPRNLRNLAGRAQRRINQPTQPAVHMPGRHFHGPANLRDNLPLPHHQRVQAAGHFEHVPLRRTPLQQQCPRHLPQRRPAQRLPALPVNHIHQHLEAVAGGQNCPRIIGGVAVLLAGVGDACAMLARLGYLGKAVRPVCYGEDCNAHYANNLSTHCAANRAARRECVRAPLTAAASRAASHPG